MTKASAIAPIIYRKEKVETLDLEFMGTAYVYVLDEDTQLSDGTYRYRLDRIGDVPVAFLMPRCPWCQNVIQSHWTVCPTCKNEIVTQTDSH